MPDSNWEELAGAIARVADGELSARVPESEDDRIARAFNRIAERLQQERTEADRVGQALAAGQSEMLALQRRLSQAQRLAALGALAATLAHDLGTPLHSVAGHLDLVLRSKDLTPEVRERATIVAGEVDRLCALLRRHLKRLRTPLPEPTPTDVNGLVERIAKVMQPVLDARSITLYLDLEPGAAEAFLCDADQVEQAVVNLIQNALDAMPGGGRLVVRTAVTETGRSFSVADNGTGIAAENLDQVFEPFFTTKAAGQGTGLGLSICREIALAHGGDVVLDSKPDLGTVVTLALSTVPYSEDDA